MAVAQLFVDEGAWDELESRPVEARAEIGAEQVLELTAGVLGVLDLPAEILVNQLTLTNL
jgi:hypothetical protein